jgi:hypothetical protein
MDQFTPFKILWLLLCGVTLSWRFTRRIGAKMIVFLVLMSLFLVVSGWILDVIATCEHTRVWLASLPPNSPEAIGDTGDNLAALLTGWIGPLMVVGTIHAARLIFLRIMRSRSHGSAHGFPITPSQSKSPEA